LKVFDLEFDVKHYYIKRSTIVEKITFNNRTFYAKFERIEDSLTPLVLEQHFQREYTIAVPLMKEGMTDYLVIEYKDAEYQRFYHLVKHLFKTINLTDYGIYKGKDEQRLQVFIRVNKLSLEEADVQLQKLSDALNEKMIKRWKTLPSFDLPESYNIITLPYKKL